MNSTPKVRRKIQGRTGWREEGTTQEGLDDLERDLNQDLDIRPKGGQNGHYYEVFYPEYKKYCETEFFYADDVRIESMKFARYKAGKKWWIVDIDVWRKMVTLTD